MVRKVLKRDLILHKLGFNISGHSKECYDFVKKEIKDSITYNDEDWETYEDKSGNVLYSVDLNKPNILLYYLPVKINKLHPYLSEIESYHISKLILEYILNE